MLTLVLVTLAGCYDAHGLGVTRDSGVVTTDSAVIPSRDGGPAPVDAPWTPLVDAGLDAGSPADCEPQDAVERVCPDAVCDGPGSYHWNGDRCHYVECGACEGADCDRGWWSREECERAHARCEATLCRATGGEWRFWSEECEHWACGAPGPVDCVWGRPVCDCGPHRRFDPTRGCVEAACPSPEPVTRQALCESTGGTWAAICCDTVCGVHCGAACAAPACDCGALRIFDEVRGCREAERCFEPLRGEPCSHRTRCQRGTVCCADDPSPVCTDPMCVWGGGVDECGRPRP